MGKVSQFLRAAKSDTGVDLWLTGDIGTEITFNDLRSAFEYFSADGEITINIYSHGGFLDDATAFYDWISASSYSFKVKVWGSAMSAATVIAAAAGRENIEMAPSAQWMIHEVSGGTEQMRTIGNDALVRVYRHLTGKKEKEVRDMLAATTTLSASDTVAHGFAGKVMKQNMRLAAFLETEPFTIAENKEMENTNTAKVALNVKLNLAQALKSMTGEGTELEVSVDEAVAQEIKEKEQTIVELTEQIAALEAAKAPEVTAEQLAEATAKAEEAEGKLTANAETIEAMNKQVEELTAKVADLEKPLADPVVANNLEAANPTLEKDELSEGGKIIMAAMKQANPLQIAQAKMQKQ